MNSVKIKHDALRVIKWLLLFQPADTAHFDVMVNSQYHLFQISVTVEVMSAP
jgi:hypothetical protein